MEPGTAHHTAVSMANVINSMQQQGTALVSTSTGSLQGATLSLSSMDSYEDVFKEITKKLYGDEALAEAIDGAAAGQTQTANIIYESDPFRGDVNGLAGALNASGLTLVTTGPNGLPPGTIVVQRRIHQDEKGRLWASVDMPQGSGEQMTLTAVGASSPQETGIESPAETAVATIEERWFESEEVLSWTTSKIARYNPSQKVFRCVDCDFVGFLSRVAEHWLGNHASLRVFQCPRCPYTSAWARCVRMHLTRQHGETLQDNSLWKENPVLEEYKTQVTKFLTGLKTKVEAKGEANSTGERRYTCPYCPYATDRRDLYNRHENIHRDEKPFQCYVCDKQFNRADHVKKHFTRMHRDSPYDIHKIKKHFPKNQGGVVSYQNSKMAAKQQQQQQHQLELAEREEQIIQDLEAAASAASSGSGQTISLQLQGTNETVTVQQIPHIAYFNPPSTPGQTGPLQGIVGVGGTKKESKSKGQKKKKSGEKMYTCSYCPWQGVDNWCLKRHLNTHIKPFLCALCDYKAARSERLATHVIKVHNKRVCHKCSFLADDTESLGQHIQDSHQNPLVKTGFNCNVCQEYFELRADLEAHAILEHQKVIVQCDLCDFRTTDELSMEAHLREKHNLQPGMGAVAAAAAAAAAAAIGQPTTTHYQMQLQTQPQIQITADQMQVIGQIAADQQQHNLTIPDQLNQSNLSSTVAAVAARSDYNQDPLGGLLPKVEPGLLEMEGEDSSLIEPEPEPETLCEKCGIEFADEQSLKLHEKRHEVEAAIFKEANNPLASKITKKIIIRSYVCSTCSYTAATKKLMMQHQRAHNGLELVCKAEFCLFSSPFENTMKEHISTEHGTEPNVRCPHCGLRMPSSSAFTYHCRLHHESICSLCVNLYRIRYGIKENDLHELVSKSDLELVNDELEARDKPPPKDPLEEVSMVEEPPSELQTEANPNATAGIDDLTTPETDQSAIDSISQAETQLISQDSADPLTQEIQGLSAVSEQVIEEQDAEESTEEDLKSLIPNNNNNNDEEYPSAVDFTSSVTPLEDDGSEEPPRKRPRLDFFPVPQAVARVRQRESWRILPTFSEVLVTPVISEALLKPYNTFNGSKTKRGCPRYINLSVSSSKRYNPAGPLRLHPFRRYLTRGTTSWLRRNRVKGFRCHSLLCAERGGWRYPRKSGYLLHSLWHHSRPLYSCDCCEGRFPHLYQAILHKLKVHPQQSDQLLISQESYLQQHHIQMPNQQPPSSSTLQFHQLTQNNNNNQLELQLAQFSHNHSLLNS